MKNVALFISCIIQCSSSLSLSLSLSLSFPCCCNSLTQSRRSFSIRRTSARRDFGKGLATRKIEKQMRVSAPASRRSPLLMNASTSGRNPLPSSPSGHRLAVTNTR